MMEAPMKTLYFLVGGSIILILMELVTEAPLRILSLNLVPTSFSNRVGKPGSIEVPPDMRILL